MTCKNKQDEDEERYFTKLRVALIDVFTAILFCLNDAGKESEFVPYVYQIFDFMNVISMPKYGEKLVIT